MRSKLLRILALLGQGDASALLCEVPKELLEGLNVNADGSVDTAALLSLCQRIAAKEEQDLVAQEEVQFERNQFLMNMIYNPSIAVNPARTVLH
ncbi:MAG: hypothetical protein EBX40_07155 [Gammaproteobacteria bacterium]|nr:hypothetical protein [Gammaproteobacteria bacterium]